MTVVFPVVVLVEEADVSPPSPPVEGRRIVEIDTPDVYFDHLHVSSAKVESCDNKSPAPIQCSRLRPNFHLKDSANDNYGFLVRSIAP